MQHQNQKVYNTERGYFMQCTSHPHIEAAGMCVYCGKPFCYECLVEVKGRMYCKYDIVNVIEDAKSASATTIPVVNITNANTSDNNQNTNINQMNAGGYRYLPPQKSRIVALWLCLFLGIFGAHRFYVGKTETGIIWLITLGLFGIGSFIDFFLILFGAFRDRVGQHLI